jgi:hypothetical protein
MRIIATWPYNVAGTGLPATTGVPMAKHTKAQLILEKTGLVKALIYPSNKFKALVGTAEVRVTAALVLTFTYEVAVVGAPLINRLHTLRNKLVCFNVHFVHIAE